MYYVMGKSTLISLQTGPVDYLVPAAVSLKLDDSKQDKMFPYRLSIETVKCSWLNAEKILTSMLLQLHRPRTYSVRYLIVELICNKC